MSHGHHHADRDHADRDRADGDRATAPSAPGVLHGVRVLDRTTGIAGPYCSKVLADAGAEVVKVEPPGGDPLRATRAGALFQFLHTSKRSTSSTALGGREADLLAAADVFLTNDPMDVARARETAPRLVVTTVTPYGCQGPWVGRPWTEFVLQAACGSTGGRGAPEDPPLSAGGRIGEWVAGTYAALGTLAAFREARRSGHGDHVDVAILDCMAVTMVTCPSVFASFAGWPPVQGTGRSIQVPSVEPTKDGYFVVTTNSGQQFQDFLVMIGRPDLAADAELAQQAARFQRRHEFLTAVHRHTTARTTAEVLEEAALLRIPAAPVLDGSTVTGFAHFVEQAVYVDNPSGRFVQPRVPYRISGLAPRPFGPAPELPDLLDPGPDGIGWSRRLSDVERCGAAEEPEGEAPWRLPLAGLRVLDCTAWWAGPSATHALAALGADVVKVESVARPDAMRFAATRRPPDADWYEWGPLFHSVNVGKRGVTLDLSAPDGVAAFERLAAHADVVIENFTPRVMDQFGLTWERLHARNPSLIMVRMPAFGLSGPWRDRTGFAQTMECLSGMAWLTGFEDGPPVLVLGACDPLAGMHAVIATLLALLERDRSGAGHMVESVMVEAALNAAAEQVAVFGATGQLLRRTGNRGPDAVPQGVYPCAGTDRWVAIATETDAQWAALCAALGDPMWGEEDLGAPEARRRHHDAIDAVITSWTRRLDPEVAAEILTRAGVPAAAVVPAREVVHNPQVRARGLFEVEHHPVTGDHEVPMLPFRLSRIRRWLRTPAPTLGQHNDEVLAEAGIAPEAIAAMRASGVIGEGFATP